MELTEPILHNIFTFLDGQSLLNCSNVSLLFNKAADNASLWEKASQVEFPHLRHTKDASPYQGDWMILFKDKNQKNTSMVYSWIIDDITINERRTSPTFNIGEYCFKLICDPYGNPNIENETNKGVSAYVQCTNTDKCTGVFSLKLSNPVNEDICCKWNSGVHHFDNNASSWGIHCITPLDKLSEYVADNKTKLTIKIRLLIIKFKVCTSVTSQGFGLEKMDNKIYYIYDLSSLNKIIATDFNIPIHSLRLWVFENEWDDHINYGFCMKHFDDTEILFEGNYSIFAENTTSPITEDHRLFFIKWFDTENGSIDYIGSITVSPSEITLKGLFEIVSDLAQSSGMDLGLFVENRPNKHNPIVYHPHSLTITLEEFLQDNNGSILIFYKKHALDLVNKCYHQYKINLMKEVQSLKNQRIIKIQQVYDLYEKCGYQLFRLRKLYTYRICKNGKTMLDFILHSQSHLDYWCDGCGTKHIKGVRYKCTECEDLDLCSFCFKNTKQLKYRAQLTENGFQYIPCTKHSISHTMVPIHPFPAL